MIKKNSLITKDKIILILRQASRKCIYIYIYKYTHTERDMYVCVCMCVCIYIYIKAHYFPYSVNKLHTHTHIHTHKLTIMFDSPMTIYKLPRYNAANKSTRYKHY